MTRTIKIAAAALGLAVFAGTAFADGHIGFAVKARQSHMQLYGFNVGILAEMAKGNIAYDAQSASAAAGNLAALTQMNQSALWPQGSDSDTVEASNAKAEIWASFPDVMAKGKALGEAVAGLQAAAGTDLEALRAAIGPVFNACTECHKAYREPLN